MNGKLKFKVSALELSKWHFYDIMDDVTPDKTEDDVVAAAAFVCSPTNFVCFPVAIICPVILFFTSTVKNARFLPTFKILPSIKSSSPMLAGRM